MENQMVWQDEYNIGVEVIDREHQRLFKIINRLLAYDDDKRQWACQEGIKYFKTHAMKHFTEEEDYMASIGYEGLETHRQIHRIFRDSTLPALERVLEHFPSPRPYALKEENLISYEQFQGTFERAKPQVSLLFNTSGSGYFAYCVIAPHLLEKGTVTPIQADNALEEIADYLARRERDAGRPKVLVVDDSSTVRVAMRSLLEKDYEVSVAESGVAAIRAISLDRPELVLLDYEMPVCDGRQTLEMLRSEKAFADIPVIFLTGRSDPDVVRALLALKPAGYLLKYLKPADIKQKIDELYQKLCG